MFANSIDTSVGLPVLIGETDESHGSLLALAHRLKNPVWVFDIEKSKICFANGPACALWQAGSPDELYERDLGKDMSPAVAKRLRQYQTDFLAQDAKFNEVWTLYPNGKPESVMVNFSGIYLPSGQVGMLCETSGWANDEPENLRSTEALLHTDVLIALFEREGSPLYMNPAWRNAAGPTQSLANLFVNPTDVHQFIAKVDENGEHRMVTQVITAQGLRWFDMTAKSCQDAVTGKPALLTTATDVSELKEARDKARFLANRDQLTGCYNRSFMLQYMQDRQNWPDDECVLAFVDIDHFKRINDRHGHEMGDYILTVFADRVHQIIEDEDLLVRLGGDEFVILFKGIQDEGSLDLTLDRVHEALTSPIRRGAVRLQLDVSIGATVFKAGEREPTVILRQADTALHAAKQAGRNRIIFYTEEMGRDALLRRETEDELNRAIANNEFILHFQPQVCLRTGKTVGVEGLVRWQHPQRGTIMPGGFIPVCEETGMIEDLGQIVLDHGWSQAIAWHDAGLDIQVSINISPRQFADPRLMPSLEDLARRAPWLTSKIELELTESVLIGDRSDIADRLERISELGYRIAIDDFGTGYSNLSYITDFPFDCLKIDQSFVRKLPKSGPIVELILTLARQVGVTVVAEGVETEDQLKWLEEKGCDIVQGYLFSKPIPATEVADFREKHRQIE